MSEVRPILIVEDDVLIRMGLVEAMLAGGFTIEECGDGAAAMAQIEASSELQGLITDIRLGDGPNGWEVAHQARKKFPNIAVIYVTGDSFADWTAEGVPNSLILQKPYADAQLMTAISNLLNAAGPQSMSENPPPE